MDWEQLREKTLGEVGTALATEGVGVAGGFLGAGFLGRQIQDRIKPDSAIVTTMDKIYAWAGNNVPKLAAWYLLRKYATIEPGEEVTPMKEVTVDVKKAFAGSIVFDTIMRLANGGRNPATATIGGWAVLGSGTAPEVQKTAQADIQRLIQENSALRTELNKALQRLATPAAPPVPQQMAPAPAPVYIQQPAPVYIQQPAPVYAQAPAPVQVHVQPTAPMVQAQPVAPPVVRYQPVAPQVQAQPVAPPVRAPVAPVRRAEEEAPPVVRVEQIPPYSQIPYSPGQPFAPYAVQPVPPAVQERQRKYGFMESQAPPAVQERQKRYGFMGGQEKDIAAMFGML